MPGSVTIKISGTKAILKAMEDFPKQVGKRREVLDPGLLAGAKVVRNTARTLAPHLTGVLKRNIIMQRWKRPEAGMAATVVVRVRALKKAAITRLRQRNKARGKKTYAGDPFYWRFVEFGTSKMKAHPFLRPAFDTTKEKAVAEAVREFEKRVQIVVQKLGRRSISQRLDTIVLGRRAI